MCPGLAHMVGDYVIQSDWMASEKTKRWWPAIAHGVSYGVPFVLVTQSVAVTAAFISNVGGPSYRLLFYPDPAEVRFEHTCDRAHRNAGVIVCAPLLSNVNQPGGHQVTGPQERPTVRASILCEDCGTHGFITDGRWEGC